MSERPLLSVILCTHNPRAEFLNRTLDSLRAQTLPLPSWELVIIDNRSSSPLADRVDLAWHPHARIVREEELGLTPARLRGIASSRAELIVFVDDDNVLQADYLEVAAGLAAEHPFLGAWGGHCRGEYEVPPPAWAQPYLCYLAVREVSRFTWSNEYRLDNIPFGAGLCIRRTVAEAYAHDARHNQVRRALGRQGTALTSGEDSDMAFMAVPLGLGLGLSPRLALRHLIPAGRLEIAYFERLLEGIAFSTIIVLNLHGVGPHVRRQSRLERWFDAYRLARQPAPVRRLEAARARGAAKAHALLQGNRTQKGR